MSTTVGVKPMNKENNISDFWAQFADITTMFEKMNDPIEHFGESPAMMEFDISETDDEVSFVLDMPGFDEGDISIKREGNQLSIHVEQTVNQESQPYALWKSIVSKQTITLPEYVELGSGEATYKNGILTVRFDKQNNSEDDSGTNIEIDQE